MTEAKSAQPQLPPRPTPSGPIYDDAGHRGHFYEIAETTAYMKALEAENESLKDERDALRSDLYELRGVVTGENFAEMQQRAEKAEAERDQALELIREYRNDLSGHIWCKGKNCCPTCIKADALLKEN